VPTSRGWAVAFVGAFTVFAGRAFGIIELFVIGLGLLVLVGGAWAIVRFVRLRLEVAREVTPLRVHAGGTAKVELRVTNLGRARSPLLALTDPVAGTKGARLHVAPLRRKAAARAAYRLPTARRGVVAIGPLLVRVQDPFGLAAIEAIGAPRVELTVYPAVEELDAKPASGNRDPHAGAEHPNALGRHGEDFYALRPYVVGDDLRRVHWPSTARNDELMVRQDELPWQGRTTVMLDTRQFGYDEDTFETAVSATASILLAGWHRHDLVRIVTTDGTDSGFASGHAFEASMEYLAVVKPSTRGSLPALTAALGRAVGGSLVVVVGRTPPGELETLGRASRRFSTTTVVVCDTTPVAKPAGVTHLVNVTPGRPFAADWAEAHRGRRREPA
jgi:uncharacterized protein (DUF58 family)